VKVMIQSRIGDTWFREEDLAANIPGRPDRDFEIATCVKYLREVWSLASRGPGVDDKTRNAILHARVQGAFANPVIVQLREQIQQQDTTISRLLAFVPPKAQALIPGRLSTIIDEVREMSSSLFKGRNINLMLSDEDDPESVACHRLTVSIETSEQDDVQGLVAAEMKLREHLVSSMSDKELRALRILVEYDSPATA